LEEESQTLNRSKRVKCLITASKTDLITLIARTTTSAIALTQVKTSTYVNHLAKTKKEQQKKIKTHVTNALNIPEYLDRHLKQ